jgi:Fur family ferric uptake transcriptional regulator
MARRGIILASAIDSHLQKSNSRVLKVEGLVAIGEHRLRTAGKRITPQRKLILSILAEAKTHLDAHDIYERGRQRDAYLSLATVYRTLNLLKKAGLIHELHLDDEHHHYELTSKDEHSHLVCMGCGLVIEVDSTAFAEAALEAGLAHGFQVAGAQVELAGYCSKCRQRAMG